MNHSETKPPSSIVSNTLNMSSVSSDLNHWDYLYEQEQEEDNKTLRRPRAETMPTQSTSNLMIDPNRQQHHHHHWINESIQSPTTPTTDQLLKGDDNNTIASTFASLGLDESTSSSNAAIHTSHSYSSLQTLSENHQPHSEWYNTNYFRGEDLRSSVANLRFSHQQQNRPRAMSAVDQQQQQLQEDNSPLLPHRSIWYSDMNKQQQQQQQQFNNRPFLRSSNSSADLLEMIARQRKATATATNSPSGSHSIIMNEDMDVNNTGWTGDSFTAGGSLSSSYEQLSNSSMNLTDMTMVDPSSSSSPFDIPTNQVPTRSLWLGQLELTTQTANELQMIFSKFGIIESIRILPDRECAFINFTTIEEALRARDALVNKMGSRLYSHSMSTVKVGFGKPDAVPLNSVTSSPTTTTTMPNNNIAIAANESAQGPTRALWVGNIPINTTQAALGSIFSSFGMIESIRVLTHKNCGFINFFNQEDAMKAKKSLQNREIMGPATGPVRIGFAKVPAVKSQNNNNNNNTTTTANGGLVGIIPDVVAGFQYPSTTTTMIDVAQQQQQQQQQMLGNFDDNNIQWQQTSNDQQQQQMMIYMMEMMGNNSNNSNNNNNNNNNNNSNVFSAVVTERKLIMQEFGEDDSDGPIFDGLHLPQNYYHSIPAAPELGQSRKVDISRLRDIRKRLDTGNISTKELEVIAIECVDELVELCSDYIGNTVIQRLFERCSEMTKSIMLDAVAPFLASIGVHKNGTWAAQKIIDTTRLPAQISLICGHIKPYVPALLLDQFGNYVVQCCLGLGPNRNQFIFDAIVDSCWEIAQGRFGARAVRATLESPHVTKRQQKYVAASLVQHALLLATNANGALLLIWLLDTSGMPGRYRVLAPRLLPHLSKLCTHKLASLTVLKLINQRQEPEARTLILDALFFSSNNSSSSSNSSNSSNNEVPTLIDEVLHDQVHGVSLVQKILSSSYIELRERQRIAERVKQLLCKLKLQHVQGYKRLMEEINMVMVDSTPGASLGVTLPGQFSISPSLAAALQAKYMIGDEDGANEDQTAAMMASFYAAAAAAAAATTSATNSHTVQLPMYYGDQDETTQQ